MVQKSIFCWILCGRYDSDKPIKDTAVRFNTTHCLRLASESQSDTENDKKSLNHLVSKFYDIESLDAFEENTATKKFEKNLTFNCKRYVCELPLKEHCETIPDNHSNAMNRLKSLEGKLKKNPQLFKTYNEIISDYIQNGIVEIVDEPGTEGNAHY